MDSEDTAEDTGSLFVSLDAPAGSTLAETAEIMKKVEKELLGIPQIDNFNNMAGSAWEADRRTANIFVFSPPMISGYGTGNSFELHIQAKAQL